MMNSFVTAVAAGDRVNYTPYIAIGAAVLVLVVLLLIPVFKKKPTNPSDKDDTTDPNA